MASSPDQRLPTEERPGSLTKFVRRASRVLRPRPVNTTQPAPTSPTSSPMIISPVMASPPPAAALASHPPNAPASVQQSRPQPTTAVLNTSQASEPRVVNIPRTHPTDSQAHSKQQQDKAQAFFAKYGFTMEAQDWTPLSTRDEMHGAWVEKKVRMRVHRECHKCHTSFGASKICISCDHVRCRSCPRWPPKKYYPVIGAPTPGMAQIEHEMEDVRGLDEQASTLAAPTSNTKLPVEQEKENVRHAETAAEEPLFIAIDPVEQSDILRTIEINRTHQRRGADVVYRAPQHRVRRICHKCDTIFKGRSTDCESCGHQRCPSCLRDPAKFSKFPEGTGYPGDVAEPEPTYPALERVWRKPRIRVRWTCHECNAVFANSNEKVCRGCKHGRCELCPRDPPKVLPRQHPEELLRGLEGKLGGLRLLPPGQVEMTGMS